MRAFTFRTSYVLRPYISHTCTTRPIQMHSLVSRSCCLFLSRSGGTCGSPHNSTPRGLIDGPLIKLRPRFQGRWRVSMRMDGRSAVPVLLTEGDVDGAKCRTETGRGLRASRGRRVALAAAGPPRARRVGPIIHQPRGSGPRPRLGGDLELDKANIQCVHIHLADDRTQHL